MLSTAAWNAFLKTLEEPPPHTIFVLATTEANKVLPTVVDRCHRFDFARPTRRADRRGAAPRRRRRGDRDRPTRRVALIARAATGSLPRRARHARAARRLLGHDDRARRRARRARRRRRRPAVRRRRRGRRGRRARGAARRRRGSPSPAATSARFFGDLEAHARALMVVQTLGEVPAELRITAEQDERLAEQAAPRRPGATSSACSTCSPPACAR